MAWNEPGDKNNDPWKNRGGRDQGPPDLDDVFKNLFGKLGKMGGGGDGASNVCTVIPTPEGGPERVTPSAAPMTAGLVVCMSLTALLAVLTSVMIIVTATLIEPAVAVAVISSAGAL